MAVAEKLGSPIENISLAERRVFDVENPSRSLVCRAVVLAESKFGTIELSVHIRRAFAGQIQGRGSWSLAGLQLFRRDCRSRC